MEKITAAIIGLGRIASILEDDSLREKPCTHAGAITANPDCELVAGCDIDKERRRIFADRWQLGDKVYADAADMLSVHKPQILVIATHPDSHFYYCRLAADFEVPVVVCEKPLADNVREARKIAKLSKQGSLVRHAKRSSHTAPGRITILTNHERRYSENYMRAKEIIKSEKLGRLLSMRGLIYMGKRKRLLDVLWHDGTHLFDIIMFLTDSNLKHKKCWGSQLDASSGTAWLESSCISETGLAVPLVLEIGADRDHLVFEMEFSFEQGRLRIGNGVFEVWESVSSPYAENFRSLKMTEEVYTNPTGYFTNMMADAVACVKERNRQPRSSAADGLKVIEYLNSVKAWR